MGENRADRDLTDADCDSPAKAKEAVLEQPSDRVKLLEAALRSREEELLAKQAALELQAEELRARNDELRLNLDALEAAARSLRRSEDHLHRAQELAHLGSWIWDIKTGKQVWSEERYRIFGLAPGEIEPGYDVSISFIHRDDRAKVEAAIRDALSGVSAFDVEYRIVRRDGSIRFVHGVGSISFDDRGEPLQMHGIAQDITDRRVAEEELRTLSMAVEQSPAAVMIIDTNGKIEYVNPRFVQLTGYTREDVIGQSPSLLKSEETPLAVYQGRWGTILSGKGWHGEFRNRKKTGEPYWVSSRIAPVRDPRGKITHYVAVYEDITERRVAEAQLKASLREKDVLIKEVNHRVKNNLQIISSLLNLQSSCIRDDKDRELFKEAQGRVRTMAIIHEMLYKSRDLSNIPVADYIRNLTASLFKSYRVDGGSVSLRMDIQEMSLDIDSIVPLGLIINELVTNSLKYAFPARRSGEIAVELSRAGNTVTLRVSDNGIGLPADFVRRGRDSLGLSLVESLTGQLNGQMALTSDNGASCKISFEEAGG